MNLPPKYKGATPGPYRWLNGTLMANHGRRPTMLTSGCAIYTQGPNGVLCDISEVSAQAKLFEDAPMLACRVAELSELLKKLVKHNDQQTGKAYNHDLSEEVWEVLASLEQDGLAADQSQERAAQQTNEEEKCETA